MLTLDSLMQQVLSCSYGSGQTVVCFRFIAFENVHPNTYIDILFHEYRHSDYCIYIYIYILDMSMLVEYEHVF